MPESYINISGREYRVEANWNAVMAFLAARGTSDLSALSCLEAISAEDATLLLVACVAEGERLEGRQSDVTRETLGLMSTVEAAQVIIKFLNIYAAQASPQVPAEVDSKKKE